MPFSTTPEVIYLGSFRLVYSATIYDLRGVNMRLVRNHTKIFVIYFVNLGGAQAVLLRRP